MQRALGPASIREYHPLITIETRSFLRRLLVNPSDYASLTRRYDLKPLYTSLDHLDDVIDEFARATCRYAGGLILLVVYGHEVKSKDDKFLSMAEKCVWLLSNRIASSGGIWPVDIFPFLKYIPTWVP